MKGEKSASGRENRGFKGPVAKGAKEELRDGRRAESKGFCWEKGLEELAGPYGMN